MTVAASFSSEVGQARRLGCDLLDARVPNLFVLICSPSDGCRQLQQRSQTVAFTLDQNKLAFYNPRLVWAAEPGDFQLFIGSASDDIRLEGKLTLVP